MLGSHSREIATSFAVPRNDDWKNMRNVYVVHYHEIALKGRNRPMFLRALQKNICRATGLPQKAVRIAAGRLIVTPTNYELGTNIRTALARVFGISSFSSAIPIKAEYGEIEKAVLDCARAIQFENFAIATTRGDKRFPMNSQAINIKLGAYVNEQFGKKVNLTDPDVTFYVEVFCGGALVYTEKILGPGGLPVGTQPKVAVMLSGGIDSPVAAYRIMKRGAPIMAVHFHSYPFTTRASIDKVKELVGILAQYGGLITLYLVPFADTQKVIVQKTAPPYRILLYRRLMMRIAEALARKENAQALVTGESLGQVASQTVKNLSVVESVATLPVFRPLIGYDKDEIIAEAKKIGTFEVSILPHDDCCTLFMPKNPATRARLTDVENEEAKLDAQTLVRDAMARCEIATSLAVYRNDQ